MLNVDCTYAFPFGIDFFTLFLVLVFGGIL
ncbi:uncharacterized protein METZ01_LOCUS494645 [marine metagenome]|uniref:Uncharacterized protein n=1 Tax=marine metagenome TaxID=408172 RepID=A0A383DBQ0_9ZZZZ